MTDIDATDDVTEQRVRRLERLVAAAEQTVAELKEQILGPPVAPRLTVITDTDQKGHPMTDTTTIARQEALLDDDMSAENVAFLESAEWLAYILGQIITEDTGYVVESLRLGDTPVRPGVDFGSGVDEYSDAGVIAGHAELTVSFRDGEMYRVTVDDIRGTDVVTT